MSDPSQDRPYLYATTAIAAAPSDPVDNSLTQQPASAPEPQPEPTVIVAVDAPLNGEILPPETLPAPETPPTIPQYPIGLIDFNLPIVVLDNADYNDEAFDDAKIVTVLKGSLHPVVITFWKHGEQCIDQFDTDGDSASGDHKVEQDQPYPRTIFVVIGRDGRKLTIDEEMYASESAARAETSLGDIAGVFPLVIEAPKVAEPVIISSDDIGQLAEALDSNNEDGDEEHEDEVAPVSPVAPPSTDAPTEMYVAGQNRRVGQTVYASRQGFGIRACRIVKLRRDGHKSLYLDPQDGNAPYWALNKNVRYG
jgi:hypothetical protein